MEKEKDFIIMYLALLWHVFTCCNLKKKKIIEHVYVSLQVKSSYPFRYLQVDIIGTVQMHTNED